MRLFTALWLPREQAAHLEQAIDGVRSQRLAEATEGLRGFRFMQPSQWHLTLCFHGEVPDPKRLGERLERRVRRLVRHAPGLEPPRLRLVGAGVFRGVLWIGVEPAAEDDTSALGALVRAAGADPQAVAGEPPVDFELDTGTTAEDDEEAELLVPIVMVSGHCGEPQIEAAFEAGATDYVCKPVRSRELVARVRAALREKTVREHERHITHELEVETEDFIWLTEEFIAIADRHSNGRVVSVLEGGYDLDALAESVSTHVQTLMQD